MRDPRVWLAFGALAVLPVVFLVDIAVVFARGYWTNSQMWFGVAVASGVVLATALLGLLTGRGRQFLSRRWAGMVVAVVTLVVSWTAAELVVRFTIGHRMYFHRMIPGMEYTFKPRSKLFPGVSGEAHYSVNSLGIRGVDWPEREQAYRILCVGGSTTACLYLDNSEHWPWLLQKGLEATVGTGCVWVGNAGKSGYATWQHVRFLEDQSLFREIDCAVFMIGINDLMRTMQGGQIYSPFGVRPLWERSGVYYVFRNMYLERKEARRLATEDERGESYAARREVRMSEPLGQVPDVSRGLVEYRQNIETMIACCRDYGIRPVFVTQPVLWREGLEPELDGLLWLAGVPGGRLDPGDARRAIDRFNNVLLETCAAENVECIDLGPLNGRAEIFMDDCHFTEAGAREVAARISAWFAVHPW